MDLTKHQGWKPDVPLMPGEEHPMIDWFGVRFEEHLHPLILYCGLLLFGFLTIRPNQRMLPEKLIYMLKFFYNFLQMFLCSYMSIEALMLKYRHGWSFVPFTPDRCAIINARDPPLAKLYWLFYLCKILDWCDTLFIIINGKVKQLTFLHCYHHISIYYAVFIIMHSYYDGEVFMHILFNSFVHAIMYTYYLISLHMSENGRNNSSKVWWKKYLTKIQLIQFVFLIAHGWIGYYNCSSVNVRMLLFYTIYQSVMYLLFTRFYQGAYHSKIADRSKSLRIKKKPKSN